MWTVTAWAEQILLAVIGLRRRRCGCRRLFSFIVELGVVADFADRTHTAEHITFYEDCVALGGISGKCGLCFHISIPLGTPLLAVVGLFPGSLLDAGRWHWRRS